jgi:hypothetical protein
MESKFSGPVNIGSDEMVTINRLVKMVMEIAKRKLQLNIFQDLLEFAVATWITALFLKSSVGLPVVRCAKG